MSRQLADRWSLSVSSAPAAEPLTVSELRGRARIDAADENDLVEALGKTARELVENTTGLRLISQTLVLKRDCYPLERFLLIPAAPLVAVSSIVTYDTNGASSTMSASDYIVDSSSMPPRIILKESAEWPDPAAGIQEANGVVVTFTAGYGASGSSVPERIKTAIALLFGELYENRENNTLAPAGMAFQELPTGVRRLLRSFCLFARAF